MKKKKYLPLIIVFILVLICSLSACNAKTIETVTPTSWDSYLDQSVNNLGELVSFDKNFYLDIEGYMKEAGIVTDVNAKINYDNDNLNNCLAYINSNNNGKPYINILANNETTYLELNPNHIYFNAKYKIEEMPMFSWLKLELTKNGQNGVEDLLKHFGLMCFSDVEVNKNQNIYKFDMNPDKYWSKIPMENYNALTKEISSVAEKLIYNNIGVSNKEELMKKMPVWKGKIVVDFCQNNIIVVKSENLINYKTKKPIDINLKIKAMEKPIEIDKTPILENESKFQPTKFGRFNMQGSLMLKSSNGNKQAVKYDYQINSDFDLFTLIVNNFDFSKLDNNNFFHFKMTHVCDEKCTEFCRSKLGKANGDILDIAFSPKDFGTPNVIINLNQKHLLSKDLLRATGLEINKDSLNNFSEYCLYSLPFQSINENNSLYKSVLNIFIGNFFALRKVEFDMDDILSYINDEKVKQFISDFTISDEFDNDKLVLKIDNSKYGEVKNYDIYQNVIIKNGDRNKSYEMYGENLLKDSILDIKLNNLKTINGIPLINIYDNNKIDNLITKNNIQKLIGKKIPLLYLDYNKQWKNKYSDGEDVFGTIKSIKKISQYDERNIIVEMQITIPSIFDNKYLNQYYSNIFNKVEITKKVMIECI